MAKTSRTVSFILLLILALFHLAIAIYYEINWDEFFRLGRIYEWNRGELSAVFESGYIYLFLWLKFISSNEVIQIIAARLIMLGLLFYSVFQLHKALRIYFSFEISALSIVFYLGHFFVLLTATSFRVDPIILALLTTAISLILLPSTRLRSIIIGVCIGAAGFISLKSAIFVPSIGLLLLWQIMRSDQKIQSFARALTIGFLAIAVFLILITLHNLTLAKPDDVQGFVSYAAKNTLLKYGVFPQKRIFLLNIMYNPVYWLVVLIGILQLKAIFDRTINRDKFIVTAIMAMPMISLLFYAHAYNYFYTFLLLPLSFVIALACEKLSELFPKIFILIPSAATLLAVNNFATLMPYSNAHQRHVLQQVHKIFPEPVDYIDRCSMVSTYTKNGLFMSYIQMHEYTEAGTPIMSKIVQENQPKFILANLPELDLDTIGTEELKRPLLDEDMAVLRQNYIHHWGPVYVAGKSIPQDVGEAEINIFISGDYTLEAKEGGFIGGKFYENGDVISLDKGSYSISKTPEHKLTLRWGNHLFVPELSDQDKPLFAR